MSERNKCPICGSTKGPLHNCVIVEGLSAPAPVDPFVEFEAPLVSRRVFASLADFEEWRAGLLVHGESRLLKRTNELAEPIKNAFLFGNGRLVALVPETRVEVEVKKPPEPSEDFIDSHRMIYRTAAAIEILRGEEHPKLADAVVDLRARYARANVEIARLESVVRGHRGGRFEQSAGALRELCKLADDMKAKRRAYCEPGADSNRITSELIDLVDRFTDTVDELREVKT